MSITAESNIDSTGDMIRAMRSAFQGQHASKLPQASPAAKPAALAKSFFGASKPAQSLPTAAAPAINNPLVADTHDFAALPQQPVNNPLIAETVAAPTLQQPVNNPLEPAPVTTTPAMAVATDAMAQPLPVADKPVKVSTGRRHVLALVAATLAGMAGIWFANKAYAPEMYGDKGMVPAAVAHAKGKNYAVFDLNLNIRALRDEQLKRMTKTPEVILLGASHWQEAHKDLLKGYDMFNAHIHRDYWEDPLGMVELLARHNRLPKKLIISVRDNQFTPVEFRKDFLWEPGIPAYRAFTKRIGIKAENFFSTLPYDRGKALISLPMLFENLTRWHNATERPHATDKKHFKTLDVLLPDGSITWAQKHMDIFTPERTRKESLDFAALRENMPPKVDPKGVYAFEKMLDYLKQQGVQVYLVHPPFNPIYYDALRGSPYAKGLRGIEDLTQRIARDHDLPVFGSFNPHALGCTADMYIDAEHSNEKCLQKIFDQFAAIDKLRGTH